MVLDNAGLIQFLTKNFSASLENIGVTEIGQSSPRFVGQGTLETGVTTTLSHCAGKHPTQRNTL